MTVPNTRPAAQLSAALAATAELVVRVREGERGSSGTPGAPPLVPTKVYGEAALLLRAADGVANPVSGEPVSGEPVSGEPVSGEPVSGEPVSGEPVARERDRLAAALATTLAADDGLWRAVSAPSERWEHLFPRLLTPGPWSRAAHGLATSAPAPAGAATPARLECAWLMAAADRAVAAPPSVTELVQVSALTDQFDLLHGPLEEAYAFTHAVLHATDQGRWPLAPTVADRAAGRARALLGAALLADNDDIAAELLWTWPMLGLPDEPAAEAVRDRLGERFDEHGFLPGPTYDPQREARLSGSPRSLYRTQTSYHTTLAWGISCASVLHRVHSATSRRSGLRDPRPLLAGLPGRWAADLAGAPRAQRCAVTAVALAAALRHAAGTGDLPEVRRLLGWALEARLEGEPIVGRAAGWLREIAALGEALRREAAPARQTTGVVGATGIEPVTAGL